MRSVLIFLRDTNEEEVKAYLDRAYPVQREPWLVTSSDDPNLNYLCIDFYRDASEEFEPEDWTVLIQRFGKEPAVAILVHVSGRLPGDIQVVEFVTKLLSHFSGSAQDDYTDHLWSLEELQLRSGYHVSGHPFFDYRGWHAESNADT